MPCTALQEAALSELKTAFPPGSDPTVAAICLSRAYTHCFAKAPPPGSYHLVKQNCNHFATAFCERLGFEIPAWVNRLAW